MRKKYWIEELPGIGIVPSIKLTGGHRDRPERPTSCLVERGCLAEYYINRFTGVKIITLFFRRGEIITRCHPAFSRIEALGPVSLTQFTHSDVFRTLRHYEDAPRQYQLAKEQYRLKVNMRLQLAAIRDEVERFIFFQKTQNWVISCATPTMLADYLGLPVELVRDLRDGIGIGVGMSGRLDSAVHVINESASTWYRE